MHRVLFGQTGQTLRHVAPEYVSSATYAIEDIAYPQGDALRTIASGAVTPPTFTLTLDAAAGAAAANSRLVPVAATAGPSIGDACVVIAADGAFEGFTVEAVSTNNYLLASSQLAGTYATSDTVRGVTLTVSVTTALYDLEAALDDQRRLRIVWQYTTAAGLLRTSEPILLSRGNRAAVSLGPVLETVRQGYPDLANRLIEGMTLEQLGGYALKLVAAELAQRDIDHAQFLLGETGHMLLVAKVVAEAAIRGYAPGQRDLREFAADAREDYDRKLAALTTGTAGFGATTLDTEDVAAGPDTTYRGPILSN